MAIEGVSPESISQSKLTENQQQVQVNLLKKQIKQEGSVDKILIESANQSAPTQPGVGAKINTVA